MEATKPRFLPQEEENNRDPLTEKDLRGIQDRIIEQRVDTLMEVAEQKGIEVPDHIRAGLIRFNQEQSRRAKIDMSDEAHKKQITAFYHKNITKTSDPSTKGPDASEKADN